MRLSWGGCARLLPVLPLIALAILSACGKKGPPLAPLQRLPARVEDLTLTRSNNEIQARFTLPIANTDGTQPANLMAVELYGLSGKPEDPFGVTLNAADFLRYSSLVGRIEVEPAVEPSTEPPPPTTNPDGTPAPPPPPKPEPPPDPRPAQGEAVTLREVLTPEVIKPFVHPRRVTPKTAAAAAAALEVPAGTPLWWPLQEDQFSRVYITVGINRRGQRGPASGRISVPLIDPPQPPAAPTLTHDATSITVTWPAAAGARLPIQASSPTTPPTAAPPPAAAPGAPAAPPGATPPPAAAPPGAAPGTPPAPVAGAAGATPATGTPASATAPAAPGAAQAGAAQAGAPQTSAAPTGAQPAAPLPPLASKPVVQGGGLTTYNVYDAKALADFEAASAKRASGATSGTATPAGAVTGASPPTAPGARTTPGTAPRAGTAAAAAAAATVAPGDALASPTPLNSAAIDDHDYVDSRVTFGDERCYVVRAVLVFGAAKLESASSPVTCITPKDTFPPAAPKNLVAVGSEGGVSLIWEANSEADLDGYLVLRGQVGADGAAPATLAPITAEPLHDTTYRDTTAKPNTRYVYAVVAVDRTTPRNVSPESNRVEELAR